MIVVKSWEEYKIKLGVRVLEHTEEKIKTFLENDFFPIVNYISSKGLDIRIPTMLEGDDATFIYRKLNEAGHNLGKAAEEFCLFLYMRLERTRPVYIEQKNLFSFKSL